MKLVNTFYNFELDMKENLVTVLSVENPSAYARIIGNIWKQVDGQVGDFILSDTDKTMSIPKEMDCIFNPFSLECNSKKIIARLYQELKNESDSVLQEETGILNRNIINYLDKLLMTVPYNLKYNFDINITDVLKMYDVGIEVQAESLLENIVEYLKVASQICNISTFVFIDLKHYLSTEDIERLYESAFYEKINLIVIEPVYTEQLKSEKCWIIDKDLCIIET